MHKILKISLLFVFLLPVVLQSLLTIMAKYLSGEVFASYSVYTIIGFTLVSITSYLIITFKLKNQWLLKLITIITIAVITQLYGLYTVSYVIKEVLITNPNHYSGGKQLTAEELIGIKNKN